MGLTALLALKDCLFQNSLSRPRPHGPPAIICALCLLDALYSGESTVMNLTYCKDSEVKTMELTEQLWYFLAGICTLSPLHCHPPLYKNTANNQIAYIPILSIQFSLSSECFGCLHASVRHNINVALRQFHSTVWTSPTPGHHLGNSLSFTEILFPIYWSH